MMDEVSLSIDGAEGMVVLTTGRNFFPQ